MYPSFRLIGVSGALTLLALLSAFAPVLVDTWKVFSSFVLGVVLVDFILGFKTPMPQIKRDVRPSVPVSVWSEVKLQVAHTGMRRLSIRVHDLCPAWFDVEGMPTQLELPANQRMSLSYQVRAKRRGDAEFVGVDLVVDSPLGLWGRKGRSERIDRVRVFPNFREISCYAILSTENRLSHIGVRRQQRRGQGNEFHQLREFRSGDGFRQIDWKATSRMRKLISKEYQDERDQQLIFLLDCGRRMRHQEDGRGHLDEALNAMLLLAYVAARQDDAVGFMTFGGTDRWSPPRKGAALVNKFMSQIYDIESSPEAADYLMAARDLMVLQQRRALVIFLTNTRDEDRVDLLQAVRTLSVRHLVVVADLRETLLDAALAYPVHDLDSALRFQAVFEYLNSRSRGHETLRRQGALTLNVLPRQLPIALVNEYLSIKASGKL